MMLTLEDMHRLIKKSLGEHCSPHPQMRPFTNLQVDHICYTIGEWYLKYKGIACSKDGFTCFGRAKEELKTMICGDDDVTKLEDERCTK